MKRARAMLQPWRYAEARRQATFHGQVRILNVEMTERTPAQVRVDAEICRKFRGPESFRVGVIVSFAVSVLSGDERREIVPIGGTRWTNYGDLLRAKYLELFLDGEPPACQIALWQSAIISALTSQPTLDAGSSIQQPPRRMLEWFRWKKQ
ncbi:MAG TPA: hypothetical protein PKD64_16725 [Pirellulaceae bacterium]|nr:hypothetical protein [Pirellulaceae bacterium]HMP71369.1 hypothetical protein [Pirellulaceae bacterium]